MTQPARPLVGRDDELHLLGSLLDEGCAGLPRFAFVTGEPGIGKTRLVEEMRLWVAHQGAVTASARSYAVEGVVAVVAGSISPTAVVDTEG